MKKFDNYDVDIDTEDSGVTCDDLAYENNRRDERWRLRNEKKKQDKQKRRSRFNDDYDDYDDYNY